MMSRNTFSSTVWSKDSVNETTGTHLWFPWDGVINCYKSPHLCRSIISFRQMGYRAWHVSGKLNRPTYRIMIQFRQFILFCIGLLSLDRRLPESGHENVELEIPFTFFTHLAFVLGAIQPIFFKEFNCKPLLDDFKDLTNGRGILCRGWIYVYCRRDPCGNPTMFDQGTGSTADVDVDCSEKQ